MNRIFRLLCTAAVGALALTTFAATAAYAATWDFTRTTPGVGSLSTAGVMNFTGPRAFEYHGSVTDNCPPDGMGGSIYFQLEGPAFPNDVTTYRMVNTTGCGTTKAGAGTINRNVKIERARVFLCATNNGEDCWVTLWAPSQWKVNPHA